LPKRLPARSSKLKTSRSPVPHFASLHRATCALQEMAPLTRGTDKIKKELCTLGKIGKFHTSIVVQRCHPYHASEVSEGAGYSYEKYDKKRSWGSVQSHAARGKGDERTYTNEQNRKQRSEQTQIHVR